MADMRIVYGAGCSWWDSIDKIAKTQSGLPCCPYCASVLYEVPSESLWWAAVDRRLDGDPGYHKFIEWLRGKCFPGPAALHKAREAYLATE
jgi:hypothetical protein